MEKISKLKNRTIFILFLSLGILLYANVLTGPFLWDDRGLVVANEFIRSFSHFKEWFTLPSLAGAGIESVNLYRPLELVFHSIIYSLFGLSEIPYHLLNILIHGTNAFLVFTLFKKLNCKIILSLVAGLLFLVHPVNTEAVSYISGLPDVLVALFTLLTLNLFLNKKPKYALITLTTICALLSKETGVVIFPLAGLSLLFHKGSPKVKRLTLIGAITLIYVLLRLTLLNFTDTFALSSGADIYNSSLAIRLISFISIFPEYLKLIFFPQNLFFEKPFLVHTTLLTLNGIIGSVILIGGGVFSYVSFKKNRIFFLGFCFTLIALLPVSGIIPSNAIYAERWLYLPLIGILIAVIPLFKKLRKRELLIAILIITLLLSGRTFSRNLEWADPIKFYENEITHNPLSPRLHNQLGRVFMEAGDYKMAAENFSQGINLDQKGSLPLLRYRLGESLMHLGQVNQAAEQYFETLKLNPNFIPAHQILEKIFEQSGYAERANKLQHFIHRIENGEKINYLEIEPLSKSIK